MDFMIDSLRADRQALLVAGMIFRTVVTTAFEIKAVPALKLKNIPPEWLFFGYISAFQTPVPPVEFKP